MGHSNLNTVANVGGQGRKGPSLFHSSLFLDCIHCATQVPLSAGVAAHHGHRFSHPDAKVSCHEIPVAVTALDDAARLSWRVLIVCAAVAVDEKPLDVVESQGGVGARLLPGSCCGEGSR